MKSPTPPKKMRKEELSAEENKALGALVTMSMHKDGFHNPIVAYGYTEAGEQKLIKRVNRRNYDCLLCGELYGEPSTFPVSETETHGD